MADFSQMLRKVRGRYHRARMKSAISQRVESDKANAAHHSRGLVSFEGETRIGLFKMSAHVKAHLSKLADRDRSDSYFVAWRFVSQVLSNVVSRTLSRPTMLLSVHGLRYPSGIQFGGHIDS
jgi:hypothetical protein